MEWWNRARAVRTDDACERGGRTRVEATGERGDSRARVDVGSRGGERERERERERARRVVRKQRERWWTVGE